MKCLLYTNLYLVRIGEPSNTATVNAGVWKGGEMGTRCGVRFLANMKARVFSTRFIVNAS
jgi:hypothetical protein